MAHSSGWEPPTSRLGGRLPEERAVENRIRKLKLAHEQGPMALGDLIHQHVRAALEQAVHEELAAVLCVGLYERSEARRGHRNGSKTRTLTGPTGPLELTLPRAALLRRAGHASGRRSWCRAISGGARRGTRRWRARTSLAPTRRAARVRCGHRSERRPSL